MTSLFENCFLEQVPLQYVVYATHSLYMPIRTNLHTDPHLSVSFKISNIKMYY